jgi:4-hydroxy-tetrahydrodipicolinate reductase
MDTIILGDGPLGQAIEGALIARGGPRPRILGRPGVDGHDRAMFGDAATVFEASRRAAVAGNVRAAVEGGVRRFVIATTGWDADRDEVAATIRGAGAAAVVAPNLAIGAAVFLRLVEDAARLLAPFTAFEPYLLEWHRRSKADRPSGTARELSRRLAANHPGGAPDVAVIRAGSAPGMHLVGFDAPSETIELRLTARDRSGYAAGALLAADWLAATRRGPGLHPFDTVVDDLIAARPAA